MTATLNQQTLRRDDPRRSVRRDLTPEGARALGRGYAAPIAARGRSGAVAAGGDQCPSRDGLRDGLGAGRTQARPDEIRTVTQAWLRPQVVGPTPGVGR